MHRYLFTHSTRELLRPRTTSIDFGCDWLDLGFDTLLRALVPVHRRRRKMAPRRGIMADDHTLYRLRRADLRLLPYVVDRQDGVMARIFFQDDAAKMLY